MEQSPSWEANSHPASQEISHLLWNPKFHYRVHNGPPLLSQINPVHIFPQCFPKIHSNIIPSNSRSSEWTFYFRFSNLNIVYISHLFHACYMPHASHPPWFHDPNNIWWRLWVVKLLTVQSSPASCHFLPLTPKYSPQHPVLKTPSIYDPTSA
jgi:hypothetical protein